MRVYKGRIGNTNNGDSYGSYPGYFELLAESFLVSGDGDVPGAASCRFLNLAVTNAGRADAHSLTSTLHNGVNRLQIQVPATLRYVVGMADPMPELRSATTDFTNSCHKNTLLTYSRRARLSSTVPLPDIGGQGLLLLRE